MLTFCSCDFIRGTRVFEVGINNALWQVFFNRRLSTCTWATTSQHAFYYISLYPISRLKTPETEKPRFSTCATVQRPLVEEGSPSFLNHLNIPLEAGAFHPPCCPSPGIAYLFLTMLRYLSSCVDSHEPVAWFCTWASWIPKC